ncbi:unnamed protein product [Closterium sp. Naga37s-1]|nr:unnamed protein product [Closterium sp. Naga37s-1]
MHARQGVSDDQKLGVKGRVRHRARDGKGVVRVRASTTRSLRKGSFLTPSQRLTSSRPFPNTLNGSPSLPHLISHLHPCILPFRPVSAPLPLPSPPPLPPNRLVPSPPQRSTGRASYGRSARRRLRPHGAELAVSPAARALLVLPPPGTPFSSSPRCSHSLTPLARCPMGPRYNLALNPKLTGSLPDTLGNLAHLTLLHTPTLVCAAVSVMRTALAVSTRAHPSHAHHLPSFAMLSPPHSLPTPSPLPPHSLPTPSPPHALPTGAV